MQSTPGEKKVKQIFQNKKDFITYSNLIINELGRCPTRSDFANNKQASLPVFTTAFWFSHAEQIKLNLNHIITDQHTLFFTR